MPARLIDAADLPAHLFTLDVDIRDVVAHNARKRLMPDTTNTAAAILDLAARLDELEAERARRDYATAAELTGVVERLDRLEDRLEDRFERLERLAGERLEHVTGRVRDLERRLDLLEHDVVDLEREVNR